MKPPNDEQQIWITASEVAEYVFCPMSWYLRRTGMAHPDREVFESGVEFHAVYEAKIRKAERAVKAGKTLRFVAFLLIIGAVVLWLALWLYGSL